MSKILLETIGSDSSFRVYSEDREWLPMIFYFIADSFRTELDFLRMERRGVVNPESVYVQVHREWEDNAFVSSVSLLEIAAKVVELAKPEMKVYFFDCSSIPCPKWLNGRNVAPARKVFGDGDALTYRDGA